MKFYINKYPILIMQHYNEKESEYMPTGLAFTILGVSSMGYNLKPVKEIKYKENQTRPILDFSPEILKSAFTEVDYLPD